MNPTTLQEPIAGLSMTRAGRESLLTALYVILGLIGAFFSGYVSSGGALLRDSGSLAGFLTAGFTGALVYAAARLRGFGFVLLTMALMFFGQVALSPPFLWPKAIQAAIWAVPVGIAFAGSGYAFRALGRLPLGKFVLMGVFVGVAYAIVYVLLVAVVGKPMTAAMLLRQAFAGFKLGGLMGVGIELVDVIGRGIRAEARSEFD